jgi:hypothetical protein
MPSSYTASARFTLQATGENNNTWGVILNQGVFQLVDDTINGQWAASVSGPHTLSVSLGATDEARMRFLNVTGGSGGTITVPSVPKGYFVRNGASGPVTISAGGTSAVFNPGEAGQCHTDGSTVFPAMINGLTVKGYVDQQILASTITTPPVLGQSGKVLSNDGVSTLSWVNSLPGLTLGTLTVTGATTLAALTTTGATIHNGSLTTTGATTHNGTLLVTGASLTVAPAAGNATLSLSTVAGASSFLSIAGNGNVAGTTSFDLLQDATNTAYMWNRANGSMSFGTNNAARMSITAAGVVNMTSALNVTGTVSAGQFNFPANAVNYISADAGSASQIILQANSVNSLTVSGTACNIAVPITSTGGDMHVNNGDIYTQRAGGAANSGVIFLGNTNAYLYFDGTNYNFNGVHQIIAAGGAFQTGPGGWNGTGCVSAQGAAGGPLGYAFSAYAPATAYGCLISRVDTTPVYLNLFSYSGTVVGSITTNGSAISYNTSSDERLKIFTGAYSAAEAVAVIQADPVRTFNWNEFSASPGVAAIGWGAQTSYEISPDLAHPAADETTDESGKPNHHWGMDQSRRTPYLWAALGAEGGILDRLAALEAQVTSLQRRAHGR